MAGRLILLCGLPGSGKTTTMETLDAVGLSADGWMRALGADLWDQATRGRVEALQWELAQELVLRGETVAVDWGVWSRRERDRLRTWCRDHDVEVELIFLDEPMEVLWQRVDARNGGPGETTITREHLEMFARELFDRPTGEELDLFDD